MAENIRGAKDKRDRSARGLEEDGAMLNRRTTGSTVESRRKAEYTVQPVAPARTPGEGKPVARRQLKVTQAQVNAAKLVVAANAESGRPTPAWVQKAAALG